MRDGGAWPASPRVPVYLEPCSWIREIAPVPFSAIWSAVPGSSARSCRNPPPAWLPGIGGSVSSVGTFPSHAGGVPPALSPPGGTAGPEATSWARGSDRPAGPVLSPARPAGFQAEPRAPCVPVTRGKGQTAAQPRSEGGAAVISSCLQPRARHTPCLYQHGPRAGRGCDSDSDRGRAGGQERGTGDGSIALGTRTWHGGQERGTGDGNMALGTGTWHWGQKSGTGDRKVALGKGTWHWGQEHGTGDRKVALGKGTWHWGQEHGTGEGNVALGTGKWHWGRERGTGDRNMALGTGMWHWGREHGTGDGKVTLGTGE
ncbi:putative per-hexamer repeat protein 5 [Serinus canaria]|uniref:putative per-hexamer repeat protein 5 n=1 Tax=Serinus canaria TaxID=9135 RepID=UPI0021CCCBB2|nr:putative per-hexamer repeat protein 5 [Serinus canaria]